MAESAALVPVPFYAPVRIDASMAFNPGRTSRYQWGRYAQPRTIDAEPEASPVYTRSGRVWTDEQVGTRVDIYV
jgi:hypothetical protein